MESGNEIMADPHLLPASHINYTDGKLVFDHLNSTKTPMAYLTRPKTEVEVKPAPFMAWFHPEDQMSRLSLSWTSQHQE